MQKLLANYLFQYKNCALPQIGTLNIKFESAALEMGVQKIHAPLNKIIFTNEITDSKSLTEYIAANKNISFDEAAYQLKNISTEILNLKDGQEFLLDNVGAFTRSPNNKLLFTEVKEEAFFAPSVYAERVIHPDDSHSILVGDKETDRNSMTEFFTDSVPVEKDKWWIWAIVIFILSAVMIFIYLNDDIKNSSFGVSHKYEISKPTTQYKNIP